MRNFFILTFLTLLLTSTVSEAKDQRVTLHIDRMTCGSCPLTIKLRTLQLDGVKEAEVSYKKASATVVYDDRKQNPEGIAEAITSLGYPATILIPHNNE